LKEKKQSLYPIRVSLYLTEEMDNKVETESAKLKKTKVQFIRDTISLYLRNKKERENYKKELKLKIEVMLLRLEVKNKNDSMDNETQARCSALKDVLDLIDEV
jgi:hypothetical protein